MTYSYTQISQYLTCPRRYRHRYLDGWKEKDTRAVMLFGRQLRLHFQQEDESQPGLRSGHWRFYRTPRRCPVSRPTRHWQESSGAGHRTRRHPTRLPRGLSRDPHFARRTGRSHLDGTRKEQMEFLVSVPLLMVDDLGMRKLPLTAAENCWKSSCAATNAQARC
jgi:hypothetical protein